MYYIVVGQILISSNVGINGVNDIHTAKDLNEAEETRMQVIINSKLGSTNTHIFDENFKSVDFPSMEVKWYCEKPESLTVFVDVAVSPADVPYSKELSAEQLFGIHTYSVRHSDLDTDEMFNQSPLVDTKWYSSKAERDANLRKTVKLF